MRDMHRPRAVALALAAVFMAGLGAGAGGDTQAWEGCDSFDTQPEAQAYWESHGQPAQADGDHDGQVCESLPTGEGAGEGCERPRRTVTVRLSRRKYPETTLHFEVAWRHDVPSRYTIARGLADDNRDAWEPLVPAGVGADGDGKEDDRDEVPMAFTKEGGRKAANGRSASHIAYVDASDNRGAGSSIGGRLRGYCNGTRFQLKLVGRRTRTAVIVVVLRNGRRVHQVVRRR
jgi:hypothetical protein